MNLSRQRKRFLFIEILRTISTVYASLDGSEVTKEAWMCAIDQEIRLISNETTNENDHHLPVKDVHMKANTKEAGGRVFIRPRKENQMSAYLQRINACTSAR